MLIPESFIENELGAAEKSVVYFDERLGVPHSKRWSKYFFDVFHAEKLKKRIKH